MRLCEVKQRVHDYSTYACHHYYYSTSGFATSLLFRSQSVQSTFIMLRNWYYLLFYLSSYWTTCAYASFCYWYIHSYSSRTTSSIKISKQNWNKNRTSLSYNNKEYKKEWSKDPIYADYPGHTICHLFNTSSSSSSSSENLFNHTIINCQERCANFDRKSHSLYGHFIEFC